MHLSEILDFAKHCAACALGEGDVAVDATVGNGHDTLFLAEQVGASGRVWGFDVQGEAIRRTKRRLEQHDVLDRVNLVQRGHEGMESVLPDDQREHVRAVMFNLGYLPGGDRTRITTPETTVPALEASLRVMAPGGVLCAVLYSGHPGGAEEATAVTEWAQQLPQASCHVLSYHFMNRANEPPRLIAVEKRGTST